MNNVEVRIPSSAEVIPQHSSDISTTGIENPTLVDQVATSTLTDTGDAVNEKFEEIIHFTDNGTGTDRTEGRKYVSAKLSRPVQAWRFAREGFSKNSWQKIAVSSLSCILCITGFVLLCVHLVGPSLNSCQRFLKDFTEAKNNFVAELDPIEISDCLSTLCNFDFNKCGYQCPFGYLSNKDTGCVISCECATTGRYQGDIAFRASQLESMLQEFGHRDSEEFSLALTHYGKMWRNNQVEGRFKLPYLLDQTLDEDRYSKLDQVFKKISSKTCIDMVPRTVEEDYINILAGGIGCESYVGRIGGMQEIQLSAGCFSESTLEHEIIHTLGFYHEHSREDRDAYVDIYKDNVESYNIHNFAKLAKGYRVLNSEYDLTSTMHYSSFVFAINKYIPTIAGKNRYKISHSKGQFRASKTDWQDINTMYDCRHEISQKTGEWNQWGKWSKCSETCGDGQRIRYRDCIHKPTGEKLARGCDGRGVEFDICNLRECPAQDGIWSPWSSWTDCPVTCGDGAQQRSRSCTPPNSCTGYSFDYKPCDLPACNNDESIVANMGDWTHWGNWSRCEGRCDKGQQLRIRNCKLNNAQVSPKICTVIPGLPFVDKTGQLQLQYCIPEGCPQEEDASGRTISSPSPQPSDDLRKAHPRQYNSQWYQWGYWSKCDRTCGEGVQRRIRACSGFHCPGLREMTKGCSAGACVGNGQLFSSVHAQAVHFCIYGTVYAGKMNRDSIPDLLCMYPDGYLEVFLLRKKGQNLQIRSGPDWEGQTGNCNFVRGSDDAQMFVKDVSNDGLDDIICYNALTKNVEVTLNQGDGTFHSEVSWKDAKETCQLVAVEDVNGDGKPDLVCKEGDQGMFTYLNVR